MLYILPQIGQSALRNAIEAHARDAEYPITNSIESASFVIGTIRDQFPDEIPPEKKIILKDPTAVDTVPAGAHIFSWYTLVQLGTYVTLCAFLTCERERQEKEK